MLKNTYYGIFIPKYIIFANHKHEIQMQSAQLQSNKF